MKTAHLTMVLALLVILAAHLPKASMAASPSSYTILFSSNVVGEIEPCG